MRIKCPWHFLRYHWLDFHQIFDLGNNEVNNVHKYLLIEAYLEIPLNALFAVATNELGPKLKLKFPDNNMKAREVIDGKMASVSLRIFVAYIL